MTGGTASPVGDPDYDAAYAREAALGSRLMLGAENQQRSNHEGRR